MFFPRRESVKCWAMSSPKPKTFVQLAHQNQAAVGGDARSLEIDLQRALKES